MDRLSDTGFTPGPGDYCEELGPERSRQRDRSSFRLQRPGLGREWADLPEWITTEEAADLSLMDPELRKFALRSFS